MRLITYLLGLALLAPQARAIGHTGNMSFGVKKDGFTAKVTPEFENIIAIPQDSLRLQGPIAMAKLGGFEPLYIEVYPFTKSFPQLSNASRDEVTLYFSKWKSLPSPDACIFAYEFETESAATLAVTWGNGSGYVAVGQAHELVNSTLLAILNTTLLETGACAWK